MTTIGSLAALAAALGVVVIVDVSWQRAVNAAKAAGLVRSTTETQLRNSSGS